MKKKLFYVLTPLLVSAAVFTLGSKSSPMAQVYAKIVKTMTLVNTEKYTDIVHYWRTNNEGGEHTYLPEGQIPEKGDGEEWMRMDATPGRTLVQERTMVDIEVPDDKVIPTEKPKQEEPETPKPDPYAVFHEELSRKIDTAIENGTADKAVEIDATPWISFKGTVLKELMAKDVDLTIIFTYKGDKYSFTIPKDAVLEDDAPYYGFLYLSEKFGRTKLTNN